MKKFITFLVMAALVGGGIGLGLFINKINNTATTVAVVSVENEVQNQQSEDGGASHISRQRSMTTSNNNASLQFVLNGKNKVLSCTYLNANSDICFVNLEANGKDFVDVMCEFTQMAINTGAVKVIGKNYINIELNANNQQQAENLEHKLHEKIDGVFDKNGIFGTIKSTINTDLK